MAEQWSKELSDDRAEMVRILHRHGLLLELSDAAFDRNVGAKNRARIFSNQIKKIASVAGYISQAETAVNHICRLGSVPEGRLKAIELLIDAADSYCYRNGRWNFESDTYHNGMKELDPMDTLLTKLVCAQYQASRLSKQDWDPESLVEMIEEVTCERYPAEIDLGDCDPRDRATLFKKPLSLLQLVNSRRIAVILANKVVAPWLPIELVAMVQDYICCDEPLMECTMQDPSGVDQRKTVRKIGW